MTSTSPTTRMSRLRNQPSWQPRGWRSLSWGVVGEDPGSGPSRRKVAGAHRLGEQAVDPPADLVDLLVVAEGGDEDHRRRGAAQAAVAALELSDRLDPFEAGHAPVHEEHQVVGRGFG